MSRDDFDLLRGLTTTKSLLDRRSRDLALLCLQSQAFEVKYK